MNHQEKLELVKRINKIQSSKDVIPIFKILKRHNVDYMINSYGVYLLFQNLEDIVYTEIIEYLNNMKNK